NYSWAATDLPAGLTINRFTGVISGVPASAGTFFPSVRLTDLDQVRSIWQTFALTVDPFAITTFAVLPQGIVGTPYFAILTAPDCGSGCTWSVSGPIPTGLSVNSNGTISGIPTVNTATSLTVVANGSNGVVRKMFGLTIAGNLSYPLLVSVG